jgi:hypothetical protein
MFNETGRALPAVTERISPSPSNHPSSTLKAAGTAWPCMRWSWVLIGLGLVLGTIAVGASAADGTIALWTDEDPSTVEPGGSQTWEVAVAYSSPTPIVDEVTVTVNAADSLAWAEPELSPSTVTFDRSDTEPGPPPYRYNENVTLSVSVHEFAPAFVAKPMMLTPEAHAGELRDPATHSTQVILTPGFRAGLEAQPADPTLELVADEEGHARAEVANRANGDTLVSLEGISAADGCEVDPVEDEVLVQPATDARPVLHVTCPAEADGGTLTATFGQVYAYDRSIEGATAEASWELTVEDEAVTTQSAVAGTGSDAGLGLAAGIGLAALATAAIAHRRRG